MVSHHPCACDHRCENISKLLRLICANSAILCWSDKATLWYDYAGMPNNAFTCFTVSLSPVFCNERILKVRARFFSRRVERLRRETTRTFVNSSLILTQCRPSTLASLITMLRALLFNFSFSFPSVPLEPTLRLEALRKSLVREVPMPNEPVCALEPHLPKIK